ncbi:MAG: winged helix-turn-helix domain-containing protein [Sulfolobales archaeon]
MDVMIDEEGEYEEEEEVEEEESDAEESDKMRGYFIAFEVLNDRRLLTLLAESLDSCLQVSKLLKNARINIPQSTLHRLLKRLVNAGVIKEGKGVDRRKRFYILTDFGRYVMEIVADAIAKQLKVTNDKDLAMKLGIDLITLNKLVGSRQMRR